MNRFTLALAALAAVGSLAACGSPTKSGDDVASLGTTPASAAADDAPTTTLDPEEAMLAYTQCMRDNGIDMPDPVFSSDGRGVIAVSGKADDETNAAPRMDPESEQFKDAEATCAPLMKDAIGTRTVDPEEQAEMREQMLAYAQCMRDHGIDFPDPVFGEDGRVSVNIGGDGEMPPDDAAMEAATEACASEGGPMIAIGAGAGATAGD